MKVLLDTHVLIWALAAPAKLPKESRKEIEDTQNEILFSAASIWEIAIKKRLGRIDFAYPAKEIAQASKECGFAELPIFSSAAALVEDLPLYHRDPFDRILVAQAIGEPARLYTVDPILSRYSELVTLL